MVRIIHLVISFINIGRNRGLNEGKRMETVIKISMVGIVVSVWLLTLSAYALAN